MTDLTTILYVEDDPDIQAVAKMALEAVGGYTVVLCSSGEQALATARASRPDLILLDVMMPGLDGPATLEILRGDSELAHVPVVFMTAKIHPAEVERYLSLGAVDVIAKPFDPMALAGTVRAIWEAAQAGNPSGA